MFFSMRLNRILLSVFLFGAAVFLAAGCYAADTAMLHMTGTQGVALRVVMYHSLLKEKSRQGKYVVSPECFENDLKYLADNGYTTVNVQDLINYVQNGTPLPEKPVMITFDDGYYNNYLYAFPLIQKYHVKVIISPVGSYTDRDTNGDSGHANYSYLTWGEIQEMMQSGLVEFQNHTYNLHSTKGRIGASKLKRESTAAYQALLAEDLGKMQQEMLQNTGYVPTAFFYPFGEVSPESLQVLASLGFQASFTCQEKTNFITRDPECLYGLGRYLRPAGLSSESYFRKIGLG